MREQNLPPREHLPGPGSLSLFNDPADAPALVMVACGPYAEQLPVDRMTVAQIRARFRDRFDIDARAVAVVDGQDVNDQTVVRAGQVLTFVQRSGEKGSRSTYE